VKNLESTEQELNELQKQIAKLDAILMKFADSAKFGDLQTKGDPSADTALCLTTHAFSPDEFSRTLILPNAPFIGGNPQPMNA
jgi:hypothetical protein